MLAAAETDLEQQMLRALREGGGRVGGEFDGKPQARQCLLQQSHLAGAQLVAALASVEPGGLRANVRHATSREGQGALPLDSAKGSRP